ncbi:MAG: anti-sigma factor family protein [Phycisphaerales bacterium]
MARRISEDDLLAFIEGDLPDDRRDEVQRALEGEPDLLAWAEGARADRAAMQEWGRPGASIAPPDLVEQAMRQAERDALLGAAGLDEAHRPRVLFRFTGPRAALAAMLVAAIGIGFVYGPGLYQQISGSGAPSATPPMPTRQSQMADAGLGAVAGAESAESRREAASGERAFAELEEQSVASAPGDAPLESAGASRMAMAKASEADAAFADAEPDANGVPMELALAPSLDEGDGAGRARTDTLRAIGDAIEQGVAAPAPAPTLTLDDAARLAGERRLTVRVEAAAPPDLAASLLAGDHDFRIAPAPDDADATTLIVEIDAGPAGLDALLQAVGALGATHVEMVERGEPVALPAARDASDVLWWSRPPASWPGMGSAVALRIEAGASVPPPPPGD